MPSGGVSLQFYKGPCGSPVACLMAAAPDLLTAVLAAGYYLEDLMNNLNPDDFERDGIAIMLQSITRAIKKAEG